MEGELRQEGFNRVEPRLLSEDWGKSLGDVYDKKQRWD